MKGQETEHTDAHFEIERKFLIAMPDRGMLEACPGASCSEIVQTYLKCGEGESRRVRKSTLRAEEPSTSQPSSLWDV